MANKRGKILFFNDKKGLSHTIFFNVFELILAFIVALALFNFITDIAEQTIFEKNYLVRDLSLLINTLYAAPGEVVYNYTEDVSKFTLDFTVSKITIYQKGREDEEDDSDETIFYLFSENKNIPFEYKTLSYEEQTEIGFLKLDQSLDVDKAVILKESYLATQSSIITNQDQNENG
jgi:hypothetical protein